ncbi:MAG TPA: hypothetical protein VLE54_09440 [Thermoanaerobaculia bacterium]|nr:hypothetical protein [Thermoanaerobaculia bacterium]
MKAIRFLSLIVLTGLGVLAVGCGRGRPVGNLSVRPTSVTLAHPLVATLSFRWTPIALLDGLEGTPRVFVHVLDGARRLLRTFDHPLPEAWTPGREQTYEIELFQSAIAERLPAGTYEITFGLYDDAGKTRWPLVVEGEEVGRREYRLATLVVPSVPVPSPTFQFSGAWLPVEPGSSKQVVARRCLRTEGAISVSSPPSPGAVRVAASVATSGPASTSAAWRVSASCTSETLEVTKPQLEWIGFPMVPTAAGPACEIRFTPPALPSTELRTLCLEALAWRPAAR